jgi:hypothetical protein
MLFDVRRRPMISKLELGVSRLGALQLGAIALIATIGLASPAFAQMQAKPIGDAVANPAGIQAFTLVDNPPDYGPQYYAPSQSGGGSYGYNQLLLTHRLKRHPKGHHPQ